jgi:hypothetical protein
MGSGEEVGAPGQAAHIDSDRESVGSPAYLRQHGRLLFLRRVLSGDVGYDEFPSTMRALGMRIGFSAI